MTAEQYLEMERAAEFKSEYFEGRVYAMSVGTYRHATIIANVGGELSQALKQKPCTVTAIDVRLRVSPTGRTPIPMSWWSVARQNLPTTSVTLSSTRPHRRSALEIHRSA